MSFCRSSSSPALLVCVAPLVRTAPLILAALLAGSLFGCRTEIEIPRGPVLKELSDRYEDPDGAILSETMAEIAERALSELAAWDNLGHLGFVIDTIEGVGQAVKRAGGAGEGISISGVTYVDNVCPGFSGEAENPDNGHLRMTLTLRDSFVEEVVWGDFTDCKMNFSGIDVKLTSTLDLYLGGPVPLSRLNFDSVLVRAAGEVEIDGEVLEFDESARIIEGDFFEILVPSGGGDIVVGFQDDLTAVSVRTSTGAFCCDFEARFCDGVDGQDCAAPVASGTRFLW